MRTILILDYGSQFTQLIARAVRELGVYCEIHPHQKTVAAIDATAPAGIILSGGPRSAAAEDAPQIAAAVWECGAPVLGVCYGMQAMAAALGGEVETAEHHEYGAAEIVVQTPGKLFAGLPKQLRVWMSHGDRIKKMPDGFAAAAVSDSSPVAAMADEKRALFGVQFHPEVAHTSRGREILSRFVRDICGCGGEWTTPNFISRAVAEIRRRAGEDGVLLALSGGVDSAVAAALLHRAIGRRLHCVLVDHGLMREGETENIRAALCGRFGAKLTIIDAADKFFAALRGVFDPEEKRRRIGELFVAEFEEYARTLDGVKFLAQGTIYPDVVESAGVDGGGKAVIKSHHNVGGLPARLNLQLLEPLRELFKDEVRALGAELGLPRELICRHPFPGPGLAVRVPGEVTPERVAVARRADAIFCAELAAAGLDAHTAQAFVVLLPVRTVGVMGDSRTYENAAAIRAVTTDDFMTADWARLPHEFLARVSSRIINSVPGINRVLYDISSKPPATVEWE
ncbi:MAG: glutamine-hydrolyzing GMP synthase [Gammaproteobacteria bacterium]